MLPAATRERRVPRGQRQNGDFGTGATDCLVVSRVFMPKFAPGGGEERGRMGDRVEGSSCQFLVARCCVRGGGIRGSGRRVPQFCLEIDLRVPVLLPVLGCNGTIGLVLSRLPRVAEPALLLTRWPEVDWPLLTVVCVRA